MKKIIPILLIMLLSSAAVFALAKMPADIKAVSDKITKITANYYSDMGKVKNAKDLAAAINRYADQMEKIAPEIRAIEEKYGNAAEDENSEDEAPADIGDFESIQKEWAEKMSDKEVGENFQKIAQFYTDPEVQKALERLNSVMESIGMQEEND